MGVTEIRVCSSQFITTVEVLERKKTNKALERSAVFACCEVTDVSNGKFLTHGTE